MNQASPPSLNTTHQSPLNAPANVVQYLSGMPREKFLSVLRESWARNGIPWTGSPNFKGKELDLHKLFSACVAAGGYERITAGSLWGHVVRRLDLGCNPADKDEMLMAGNELCEIYRTYCFNFEQIFLAAVQKQQESLKPPARGLGQHPAAQAPVQQTPQSQSQPAPHAPQTHLEHLQPADLHHRPAQDPLVSVHQAQAHLDNIATDPRGIPSHASAQPSTPHQPQQGSSLPHVQSTLPHVGLPQQTSQPVGNQKRAGQFSPPNSQQPIPQLSSHSAESIMLLSDDALREMKIPEEFIAKIRLARLARDQKGLGNFNRPNNQPPNPNEPSAPLPQTPLSNDARQPPSAAKILEATNIIDQLKTDCLPHARALWQDYKLSAPKDLTPADKEQYGKQMDEIAGTFRLLMPRLPEFLVITGGLDHVKQLLVMASVFHMGFMALKQNEYCLGQNEMKQIRDHAEGVKNFIMPRYSVPAAGSSQVVVEEQQQRQQPAPTTVNSPQFEQHLKQGLRVEDLKQPPSKRAKLANNHTSPELSNVSPSPLDPLETGSPLSTKSPGGPAASRRNAGANRGGQGGKNNKKTQASAKPTVKASHLIMAEVKAELAAKKKAEEEAAAAANAEAQTAAKEQPNAAVLPSAPKVGNFGDQGPGSLVALPEDRTASTSGAVEANHQDPRPSSPDNTLTMLDDLMKDFWEQALPGSSSLAPDLIPDLKLPIIPNEGDIRDENLLSGGWLKPEMVGQVESKPEEEKRTSRAMPLDMAVFIPSGMESGLIETNEPKKEGPIQEVVGRKRRLSDFSLEPGCHPIDWSDDILGMFFRPEGDDKASDPTPTPASASTSDPTPIPPAVKATADMSVVKRVRIADEETPAFSPSKLSSDSTPGSDNMTESNGVNNGSSKKVWFGYQFEEESEIPFELMMLAEGSGLSEKFWTKPFGTGLEGVVGDHRSNKHGRNVGSKGTAVIAKSF